MTAVDNDLKCNNIQCRAQLGLQGQAVVTMCSHAFCLDCANRDLVGGNPCPACGAPLTDEDDVVISSLSPSAGYKYTILAGMTPALILEIASKALAFWTYQTSTESALQSISLKKTNARLEEARQTNGGMQHDLMRAERAIKDFESQLNTERRRSQGFEQALKEKDRELLKMKGMSDNMMKRAVLGSAAQNESMRTENHQPSPFDSARTSDRRRMMTGTPVPTHSNQSFRSSPHLNNLPTHQAPLPRGGPFFYPKTSASTSAYNSHPHTQAFQLHQTKAGPGSAQGGRQQVTRDVSYAAQERHRGGQAGSVANSGDGKKFNSRQPVGPPYFGAA